MSGAAGNVMHSPLVTVLLGDPRLPDRSKPGECFTPDDLDQVKRLKAALDTVQGYAYEYWDDHAQLLTRLQEEPPEFVLNFCDTGFRNEARHELHVTACLEMLGVPYSGSGPVALGICYDKALVRALADAQGVAVPREALLTPSAALPLLEFPVFIKPNRADGSVGITERSLASDDAQAAEYLTQLRATMPGADIIVQEFLAGTEYSVGLIGNPDAGFDLLPVLEVDYTALPAHLPRLLDYGSKTDPQSPYWTDVRFREARLEGNTLAGLHEACTVLFNRLGLRDYGRFDFRCDARGTPRLLEVNPNPAWCWDGKLAHMAGLRGESHGELLAHIVNAAHRRCFSGQ